MLPWFGQNPSADASKLPPHSPSKGSLVMREVFSTLVTEEVLGTEIRELEIATSLHGESEALQHELRQHEEGWAELDDILARQARDRDLCQAARLCLRTVERADSESLLRCFVEWQWAALHGGGHPSRLHSELLACEHALETQRAQHANVHDECARLRAANSELARRLELELARNQVLVNAGAKMSERASCATRELLASRHELVAMTAAVAMGGGGGGAEQARR